jgi:ribonuclease P protein component
VKRRYSLKGRKSFKLIYKKGKIFRVKGLRIFVISNQKSTLNSELKNSESGKGIRIGITIDRRVGKAVVRNSLKRKIKSIIYELLDEIENDNWIVIRPGIDALDYTYMELNNNIRRLLKESGLINNDTI